MIDCKYTRTFPVDEWDRPGGLYSLSDVPINSFKDLVREGVILSKDSCSQLFEVKDVENGWVFNIPMGDVEIHQEKE